MIVTDIHVPLSGGRLVDLDLRNGTSAAIVDADSSEHLLIGDWTTQVPSSRSHPLVRLIDDTTALVVDRRTTGSPNAWIVRKGTGILTRFLAGDGVQDVLVAAGVIVVTYFDEGIFSHIEPGSEGLAVFSQEGDLLWGYRSTFGNEPVRIDDCYCACVGPDERIWFCPYMSFPLVVLDTRSKTNEVFTTPDALAGPHALSTDGSTHWFFGLYKHPSTVFRWSPGDPELTTIGTFDGRLRGLTGGRFINVADNGGQIVSVAA